MSVSQVHRQAITSGVITVQEIHWLAHHRDHFTPQERQVVSGLIRFLQQGVINFGCRLADPVNRRHVHSAELQAV
ncbi:hypothetical protein KBY96_11370 [Cyanobium sp. ATX 6A2]|jgi:hypothetical protein|uniref:hypothetical protein n=1 Tax=Cyanobium sp. ATX 6A2 TaxID=2823700 RepID=UPI0020CBC74B|nr:hypothetical protein [Cyanobium sp. ATX 6A2]MCP9888525.1 hypothetical protein [Cyanobium sp. ATX 6A2]